MILNLNKSELENGFNVWTDKETSTKHFEIVLILSFTHSWELHLVNIYVSFLDKAVLFKTLKIRNEKY